jgi:plastocyanin
LVNLRFSGATAVGAAVLLLAAPGAAMAKTKLVYMGPPPKQAGPLNQPTNDVNAFFPSKTTIHVGDKVKFAPVGFHNVDLPKKGGSGAALIVPNGTTVTGANDAAGAPFWFNGQPNLSFNPALVTTQNFGKKLKYNGKKAVQSGLPLGAAPKPMTVTFKKAGTYTYFCDVHPGMKGRVSVKKKGKKIPSKKADAKRVKKQVKKAIATAAGLANVAPPANTVDVGVAGKGGVERFVFAPANLTVPVGTTVTFQMSQGSFETHTATTGPGDPSDPNTSSYLRDIAATFEGAPMIDPRGIYPSEQPPTVGTLTPGLHGNGFWNSGAIDANASPLPSSSQVTFGQAGTYTFYCLIHPFMKGTVTAQ